MALRIALGLAVTLAGLALVALGRGSCSGWFATGRPAPGRMRDVAAQLKAELMDVFGQRKLLRRPLPGLAHFFVFWGFIILILTIIEAYGDLFSATFAIPLIGHARVLGFLEDFFAVGVLFALVTFTAIRITQSPKRRERRSRFYGSHTSAAWITLSLIFGVIATLLLYRGAQVNTGHFPYGKSWWPFASRAIGGALSGAGHGRQSSHRDHLPHPPARRHLGILRVRAAIRSTCTSSCPSRTCSSPAGRKRWARSERPPISTPRR